MESLLISLIQSPEDTSMARISYLSHTRCLEILKGFCSCKSRRVARKPDKPVILYGAGNLGKLAKGYFNHLGIPVLMILDRQNKLYQNDPYWKKVNILHPDDCPVNFRKSCLTCVCIVTAPYLEIKSHLTSIGFKDVIHFYDITESYKDLHPLNNGWLSGPLSSVDLEMISYVFERLEDDISRAHYLQFLAWRVDRKEISFDWAPINPQNRYFIDEVARIIKDNEVFLDGGACHGKVLNDFINLTNGRFAKIFAVEPDPGNLRELEANIPILYRNKVEILPFVLGEEESYRHFWGGFGQTSRLDEACGEKVKVVSIDTLGLNPSYVKLHLEGNELSSLIGAKKTLVSHRPIIAATVYHNHSGIWKTQKWLMDNLQNYRFFMRLHCWCGTGAVIYAVPKERILNGSSY